MIVDNEYSASTFVSGVDSSGTVTAIFEALLVVNNPLSASTFISNVASGGIITAIFEPITGAISIPSASLSLGAGTPIANKYESNDFISFIDDDLTSIFFNLNEFAEPVRYRHRLNVSKIEVYSAIFDNPHYGAKISNNEFNTLRPQIQLRESILRYPISKSDEVQIKGVWYVVEDYLLDGVGVVTIYLNKRR